MSRRDNCSPPVDIPASIGDVEIDWTCKPWTSAQYAAWHRFWAKLVRAALSTTAADPASSPPEAPGQRNEGPVEARETRTPRSDAPAGEPTGAQDHTGTVTRSAANSKVLTMIAQNALSSTSLTPFTYHNQPVRTMQHADGSTWWVAADVCEVLGQPNVSQVCARLDNDEKGIHNLDTLGGRQEILIVSEPGLYKLILRSRKQEAKVFQRWVTHEVLPQIRKTGSYGQPPPKPAASDRFPELRQSTSLLKPQQRRAS